MDEQSQIEKVLLDCQNGKIRGEKNQIYTLTVKFKNKKDKVLKISRGRDNHIQRTRVMGISGFSTATPDKRRQQGDIFKEQKKKNLEHRLLCAARLSFKCEIITKFPIIRCPRQCNKRRKRNQSYISIGEEGEVVIIFRWYDCLYRKPQTLGSLASWLI